MIYVEMATVLAFYYRCFLYYRKLFPEENKRVWPFLFMMIGLIAGGFLFFASLHLHWLLLPVAWVAMAIALRNCTSLDWLQSFGMAGFSVVFHFGVRGVISAIFSLVLYVADQQLLQNDVIYELVTVIAIPIAWIMLVAISRNVFSNDRINRLLQSRRLMAPVFIYELVATANLIILNLGRSDSQGAVTVMDQSPAFSTVWFLVIMLVASVLSVGMLSYLTYYVIQTAKLSDYRLSNQLLEEQNNLLLRHYKTYQKYTDNLRTFKHDYQAFVISMRGMLEEKEYGKAMELIDGIDQSSHSEVLQHKKYADSVVLDAMMRNFVELCEENEIQLVLRVSSARNFPLTPMDSIRIFHNASHNAVEACQKLPVSERFIEMVTWEENSWSYLQVKNSYDGQTRSRNGKLLTTKSDAENHGLGMSIITEATERAGGMVHYTANPKTKVFTLQVMIPLLTAQKTEMNKGRSKAKIPPQKAK